MNDKMERWMRATKLFWHKNRILPYNNINNLAKTISNILKYPQNSKKHVNKTPFGPKDKSNIAATDRNPLAQLR